MNTPKPVPDYLAPLVGWRAWNGVDDDGYLQPLNTFNRGLGQPWPFRQPACSKCTSCGNVVKPSLDNHSGMYAFKKVLDLYKEAASSLIVGQIYLWGTVVECGEPGIDFCECIRNSEASRANISFLDSGAALCSVHGKLKHVPQVKGWRSQYAYPKQLLVQSPTIDIAALREHYGVEVEFGDFRTVIQGILRGRGINPGDIRTSRF